MDAWGLHHSPKQLETCLTGTRLKLPILQSLIMLRAKGEALRLVSWY